MLKSNSYLSTKFGRNSGYFIHRNENTGSGNKAGS